jgi:hypothetical protein
MNSFKETYKTIEFNSVFGEQLLATYTVNLNIIQQNDPVTASLLEQKNLCGEWQLFTDDEFRYGLKSSGEKEDASWTLLTDFDSISVRQKKLSSVIDHYSYIIFLGTGIGELLLTSADFFYNHRNNNDLKLPNIWIIEPRPEFFIATLMFMDLHDLWSNPKVTLFIGSDCFEKVSISLRQIDISHNQILLAAHPGLDSSEHHQQLLNSIIANTPVQLSFLDNLDGKNNKKQNMTKVDGWYPFQFDTYKKDNLLERYSNNIKALKNYEHLYGTETLLLNLENEHVSLLTNKKGQIALNVEVEVKKNILMHLCIPTEQQQSLLKTLKRTKSLEHTYLILGSGEGHITRKVLEKTVYSGQWKGFQQIVYLLELHPVLFKIFLYFTDITAAVKQKRFRMFVGSDAIHRFDQYLCSHLEARIPNQYFSHPSYQSNKYHQFIQHRIEIIRKYRETESLKIIDELKRYYNSVTLEQWQQKFKDRNNLKVMGLASTLTSFLQYCMRDLMEGFQDAGHSAELIIEKDALSTISILEILRSIKRIKPDLILNIDHLRDETKWLPQKVPFVCWIQDTLPQLCEYTGLEVTPWDTIYVISKPWIQGLKDVNKTYEKTDLKMLSLGINKKLYFPITNILKQYDISYISHISNPEDTLWPFRNNKYSIEWNNEEMKLIKNHTTTRQQLNKYYFNLTKELDKLSLEQLTTLLTEDIQKIKFLETIFLKIDLPVNKNIIDSLNCYSRLWRDLITQIKWRPVHHLHLNGIKIAVWGNNWDKLPGMKKAAKGVAANGAEINNIQNQSIICLNNSGGLSFHMRAAEIMGSGSFMLSRKIINDGFPLTDYFEENKEVVFFSNEQDLLKKVRYYLKNNKEREAIASTAHKKLVSLFSYEKIAEKIIDDISERFENEYYFPSA